LQTWQACCFLKTTVNVTLAAKDHSFVLHKNTVIFDCLSNSNFRIAQNEGKGNIILKFNYCLICGNLLKNLLICENFCKFEKVLCELHKREKRK